MRKLPALMNAQKLYLHMEQFLLETNWRLGERFLYNQDYKKYPHGSQLGREASGQDLYPWDGAQRKREITWAEILPRE